MHVSCYDKAFGARFHELLKKYHLSASDAEKITGISSSYINELANPKRGRLPTEVTFEKIIVGLASRYPKIKVDSWMRDYKIARARSHMMQFALELQKFPHNIRISLIRELEQIEKEMKK